MNVLRDIIICEWLLIRREATWPPELLTSFMYPFIAYCEKGEKREGGEREQERKKGEIISLSRI